MWAEDKGRQTEPLLRHADDSNFKGVKEDGRKWNDILFGILFIAMCVGMVSISSFAFSQGNPSSLIPSWEFAEKNITATAEQRSSLWFQDAVAQMKNDRDIIGGGLGLSIVLAALWVQLMKKFTKFFIYFTLIAGLMAVLALGVYTLTVGAHKQSSSIKGLSYGIFGLAGILIIAMIFLRKRIALTCELFKECCLGLQWNPSLFIIVFIIVGAISLFSIYWFLTFVYLYSIPKDTTYQVPHAPPQFETSVRNLMYYQIFGYFWVTSFLSAVFQMTVAGAIATWYFSRDINGYSHNSGSPAFRTLTRAFTKSFGSLAFGSLILATIKFINFILKTAEQKSKAVKNPVASFALKCVRCIFGCVQRLVQFINRFAYIHIAMHGESFCSSARNVFNLMSRNYFDAVFTDLLGEFVLFVGRILGTAACTIFTMGLVHGLGRHLSGMTVTVVAVIAWVIFTIFAHIVGTGVDTVFVCYLEDSERNKENLYVSPDLHKMLKQRSENDRIRQKGNNM